MGIQRKGKGKARKPPTPWLRPKAPKGNNYTNHQPQKKKKKLTLKIQHALRNQCRKFISLPIDIIPPSSFNGIIALPPPSSFLVHQQGLLIAYWLLTPWPLCAAKGGVTWEDGGSWTCAELHFEEVNDHKSTIKLTACVSNLFGSECERAWWD